MLCTIFKHPWGEDHVAQSLERAVKDYTIFRAHCERLEITHNMFQDLFQGDDQQNAFMKKMCHVFFHDLNDTLLNYFLVQVYKLTDPATSKGRGKQPDRANLTFHRIKDDLNDLGLLDSEEDRKEISTCAEAIQSFRDQVAKAARNRVCAHLDLETLRELDEGSENDSIGAHEDEDRHCFFLHLYRFLETADRLLGVNVGSIRDVGRLPEASPKEMFRWIEAHINEQRR